MLQSNNKCLNNLYNNPDQFNNKWIINPFQINQNKNQYNKHNNNNLNKIFNQKNKYKRKKSIPIKYPDQSAHKKTVKFTNFSKP